MTYYNKMRAAQIAAGFTSQDELGRLIGLKRGATSHLQAKPSKGLITFARYARVTGMSADDILDLVKEAGGAQ